jgi:hypothetical protein
MIETPSGPPVPLPLSKETRNTHHPGENSQRIFILKKKQQKKKPSRARYDGTCL